MEQALTVDGAAELLRVHPNSLYRAIRDGDLKSFRVGKGRGAGHRIWPDDLKAFADSRRNEVGEVAEVSAA